MSEAAIVEVLAFETPSNVESYYEVNSSVEHWSEEIPEHQLLGVANQMADGNHQAVRYVDHPYRDPVFRRLRVSGIRLLTSELELIEAWRDLRFLDLTSLHIAGVTFYQNRRKYELPGLASMTELEKLSLAGTGVGDHAIRTLSNCRNLKYLDLRMTDLNGKGLTAISGLRELEVLRLSHNMIEDDSLKALSSLTSLKRLELDSTDITDAGLKHLRSLSNLKELSISHTLVTEAAAKNLQTELGLRGLTTFRKYDSQPKFQSGPAVRPLIGIGDGAAGRAINKRREAPYTEELIRRGFELKIGDDGRAETAVRMVAPVTIDQLRFASRLYGLRALTIPADGLTEEGVHFLSRLPGLKYLTLVDPGISKEHFDMLRRLNSVWQVRLELGPNSAIKQSDIENAREAGVPWFLTPIHARAGSRGFESGQSERSGR